MAKPWEGEGVDRSDMPRTRESELRRNSTAAERRLWQALRNRQVRRAKFRRQQRIGPYVVDFVCHEYRLVVEVDGGQHATADERRRTDRVERDGYRVIRFWNSDVLGNLESVVQEICRALRATPHPPIARGDGSPLSHERRGLRRRMLIGRELFEETR